MPRLTDNEIIIRALIDAFNNQMSLADAYEGQVWEKTYRKSKEYRQALAEAKRYLALLKRLKAKLDRLKQTKERGNNDGL